MDRTTWRAILSVVGGVWTASFFVAVLQHSTELFTVATSVVGVVFGALVAVPPGGRKK